MANLIDPSDLAPFATIDAAKAEAMIEDAQAWAFAVAPCLVGDLTDVQLSAVRAVLRAAILRWHEAGSGAVQQQSAGPFAMSLDTRQERRGMFWPSEIKQLQDVCAGSSSQTARNGWLA